MKAPNALYACVKTDIKVNGWTSLGALFEGSHSALKFTVPTPTETPTAFSSSDGGDGNSNIFTGIMSAIGMDNTDRSITTSAPTQLCHDHFDLVVGSWRVVHDTGHVIEVRVTDLHRDGTPPPSEIVISHQTRNGFRNYTKTGDGTPIKGFVVKPMKITMDTPMNDLLGATCGQQQIVGVQATGSLQFNKETAVNLQVKSVVVAVTRGMSRMSTDGFYQFFQGNIYDPTLNILVEVLVDDHLMYYCRATEAQVG